MSNLQHALDWWDGHEHNNPQSSEHMAAFVETARRVANLDIKAAADRLRWTVKSDEQAMKLATFVVNLALGTEDE